MKRLSIKLCKYFSNNPSSVLIMKIVLKYNLDEIKEIYEKFEISTGHQSINLSYRWMKLWYQIFQFDKQTGKNKTLIIALVYDRNKLIAIAPLMISVRRFKKVKLRILSFAGQSWGATYCDILSMDKAIDFKFIINEISKKKKFDVVWLDHIPSFTHNFPKETLIPYEVCPEINLSNFDDYSSYNKHTYSKSLKQNIRTSFNRAKKNNEILKADSSSDFPKYFNRILEIAKTKLRDKKEFKYANKLKSQFRYEIMDCFNSNITTVFVDNKLVAYRTNLMYNGTKFCFDASYDRDYPKYNLGIISVDSSIKDSFLKNLNFHCEGPGLDYYKTKFATQYIILNYYLAKGNTIKSYFFHFVLKFLIKRKSKLFLHDYKNNFSAK